MISRAGKTVIAKCPDIESQRIESANAYTKEMS
jgi:hypothetical protein